MTAAVRAAPAHGFDGASPHLGRALVAGDRLRALLSDPLWREHLMHPIAAAVAMDRKRARTRMTASRWIAYRMERGSAVNLRVHHSDPEVRGAAPRQFLWDARTDAWPPRLIGGPA